MDINHIERSAWYVLPLGLTWLYLAAGPLFALRCPDPRVLAALPLIGNTTAFAYLLFDQLRIFEEIGYEPTTGGAVAAGVAEALSLWWTGAVVAGMTSLAIALLRPFAQARAKRTRTGTVALVLGMLSAFPPAALAIYMNPVTGAYRPGLAGLARIPFGAALLALIVAVASLVWPTRGECVLDGRRWFLLFAAGCGLAAVTCWGAAARLTAFARRHPVAVSGSPVAFCPPRA